MLLTAVPWLRRLVAGLPPRKPGFDPGSVHVGFVVDKVALGQVLPLVLRFFPVSFIPPVLHYLEKRKKKLIVFVTGLHNKPLGCGASVESAAGPFTTKKVRLTQCAILLQQHNSSKGINQLSLSDFFLSLGQWVLIYSDKWHLEFIISCPDCFLVLLSSNTQLLIRSNRLVNFFKFVPDNVLCLAFHRTRRFVLQNMFETQSV